MWLSRRASLGVAPEAETSHVRHVPVLVRLVSDEAARAAAASAVGAADASSAASAASTAGREPQTFPTERLLAIFWHLCAAEASGGESVADGGDCGSADQSADVMSQLASLVSLGLLSRERDGLGATAGGPLDSTRYASRVPRALAERVARNVQVDLRTYLLMA